MRDAESALSALGALQALGLHLAVDDFGTGYSSLAYLERLPVEALKIDRSFTDGVGVRKDSTAIVGAVVGLARALRLSTVAEGIETREQFQHLRAHGVRGGAGLPVRAGPAARGLRRRPAPGVRPAPPGGGTDGSTGRGSHVDVTSSPGSAPGSVRLRSSDESAGAPSTPGCAHRLHRDTVPHARDARPPSAACCSTTWKSTASSTSVRTTVGTASS